MIIIFGFDEQLLEALCQRRAPSPEEFLIDLETQLENDELTLSEAAQMVRDFNRKK